MLQKRTKRNDQEWMELIHECRQSGLSDQTWYSEHEIPISTFYNHISYFRKRACDIQSPSWHLPLHEYIDCHSTVAILDLKQQVGRTHTKTYDKSIISKLH